MLDVAIQERLARDLQGETRFDSFSCGRYATDASIYQMMPAGVIIPKAPGDIAVALLAARDADIPLTMRGGDDVSFIACGVMVLHALQAAEQLAKEGVEARVINLHTIKPIDRAAIIAAAKETGAIVTAEEHTVVGGLGGAVAEVVVQEHPVPMRFFGVLDRFGTSGDPAELLKAFHLMPEDLVKAAKDVLRLKQPL